MQKAQTGELSQADQARLRELMQEVLAEAGIDLPGGGQGGFGVQPIQGTISYVFGSTLTLERSDDSGLTTDVEVSDDTNITLIRELSIADLSEGNTVAGAVRRGEGGKSTSLRSASFLTGPVEGLVYAAAARSSVAETRAYQAFKAASKRSQTT